MKYKVWDCRIVMPADAVTPSYFDHSPRRAAIAAVEAAGVEVIACFSGLGGRLTRLQLESINEGKQFTFFENQEGGMADHTVGNLKDLTRILGLDSGKYPVDAQLLAWGESAEVGDHFDHRLGVCVRVKDKA